MVTSTYKQETYAFNDESPIYLECEWFIHEKEKCGGGDEHGDGGAVVLAEKRWLALKVVGRSEAQGVAKEGTGSEVPQKAM